MWGCQVDTAHELVGSVALGATFVTPARPMAPLTWTERAAVWRGTDEPGDAGQDRSGNDRRGDPGAPDGHQDSFGVRVRGRGHDAGGREHPAVRPPARGRLLRARGDHRVARRGPACRPEPDGG